MREGEIFWIRNLILIVSFKHHLGFFFFNQIQVQRLSGLR